MPGGRDATRSADRRHDLVGDVEVGVHVLDVVAVLERVDQLEDLPRPLLVQRYGHRRHEARLGRLVVDPGVLQRRTHRDQVARLGDHLERLVEVVDLLRPGVQPRGHHVFFGQPAGLRDNHHALAAEHVRHAPRVGEAAAVAGQRGAYLAGGAVAVVGEALDQDRDAVGAVALVHDRLVFGAARLQAAAAAYRPVDVV